MSSSDKDWTPSKVVYHGPIMFSENQTHQLDASVGTPQGDPLCDGLLALDAKVNQLTDMVENMSQVVDRLLNK